MNSRTWISALHTVKVLCAIDKPAHADYVQGMYDELENRFSDEEIKTAVRQIAEKEELYGNYPSLRVWLKYCPQTKAIRHENDKLKTEFLDEISAVMWLDHLLYDHSETEKHLKKTFGWHGFNAFQRAGISLQSLRGYYHTNDTQKKQVLDKFARAWDETENKNAHANDKIQIAQEKPVQLPKG